MCILDEVWKKRDEAFHEDWLDSNLFVEAVLAKERDVFDEIRENLRHFHIALYNISHDRNQEGWQT